MSTYLPIFLPLSVSLIVLVAGWELVYETAVSHEICLFMASIPSFEVAENGIMVASLAGKKQPPPFTSMNDFNSTVDSIAARTDSIGG
ncbi:hypothetical protein [Candidatus Leptofilum sp.]|uniref:hypothetical protein n=1 Tax=Candidatus Leptofilum sp. TaxID=3241576 RepID=UPI003B5BB174